MSEKSANDLTKLLKSEEPPRSADEKQKEKSEVTSNLESKERKPAEHVEIDADQDKRATPSTSGPKGTEEPGTDEGPGGTGW